ncbi:phospho-N-acetylmuramoyl-pentapeptide-transferase [Caldanaerobius polysaccharolyticus]|uniref:phospho-N-acetylmuramoyl-pentapeptide- transferase n=1 Tax=Caldanaerobius polysaccharolyticus TaxID=44256 RepID=UPI00047CA2AC|nr:phospho-N-acetylmuramoyl-pentapeptide-transferase [Caldanaerobius polysaccharolyticus]
MQLFVQLIAATIVSFIISMLLGPLIIPTLRALKFGQTERLDGPRSHLSKSGTPTMGGIIFMVSTVITGLIFIPAGSDKLVLLLVTIGFGMIGFIDDLLKVVFKRSLGLKARLKLLLQFVVAAILAYYAYSQPGIGTKLYLPYGGTTIDLGKMFIPFTVFVVVGTVNSVNITDGLDGLASGITFIISTFFAVVSMSMGNLPAALFSGSITGATLGFLRYNLYPAQVFMGDTGSLMLGGALAAIAVLTRLQLILPIVGLIFVVEALSVIIQVVCFRLTGKRVFKMSPIHHHFELCGWPETRVVHAFWLITLLLVVLSFVVVSL